VRWGNDFAPGIFALAGETIDVVYAASRAALLKRLKRPAAEPQPGTEALLAQVKTLFEKDAQRFYTSLLDGTPRSNGIREIVEGGGTLGNVVLAVRLLFAGESFRVSMWAEALVWSSWMAGFRSGAVDATAQAKQVSESLPLFEWRGPTDEKVCDPCLGMFKGPVTAESIADLPNPWDVCLFRFG